VLQVLGCARSASRAAIRTAYLERMKLLHPDVNPSEDTTQQAVAINAAYLQLMQVRECGAALALSIRSSQHDRSHALVRPRCTRPWALVT
jgi:hypothetical protein